MLRNNQTNECNLTGYDDNIIKLNIGSYVELPLILIILEQDRARIMNFKRSQLALALLIGVGLQGPVLQAQSQVDGVAWMISNVT